MHNASPFAAVVLVLVCVLCTCSYRLLVRSSADAEGVMTHG